MTTLDRPRCLDLWTSDRLNHFLKDIDGFVFDCDGVLWEGKREIPNANLLLRKYRYHHDGTKLHVTSHSPHISFIPCYLSFYFSIPAQTNW
jgi:hypothetical protein